MNDSGVKPRRILIVKLSAVGDVVHALPALNALRTCFPEATIGWVAHPGPASLLEGHPQLDYLYKLPRPRGVKEALSSVKNLRKALCDAGPWDVAIDFQGLTKSGLVSWLSGARQRIGFQGAASREVNALFMTTRVPTTAESVIHMNLQLLAPLGCHATEARAVLIAHEDDREYIRRWAEDFGFTGERFFVLDSFAGWETKRWPRARWVRVAAEVHKQYGLPTLLFHGPGEQEEAHQLAAEISDSGGTAVVAPKTTLRQYIALLEQHAALMAGGDTGPMHIAAALGIPTVALFGSSCSRRNAPAFSNARFEAIQDFSQPCAGTFWRKCSHHAPGHCMDGITEAEVLEAVARLLCS